VQCALCESHFGAFEFSMLAVTAVVHVTGATAPYFVQYTNTCYYP